MLIRLMSSEPSMRQRPPLQQQAPQFGTEVGNWDGVEEEFRKRKDSKESNSSRSGPIARNERVRINENANGARGLRFVRTESLCERKQSEQSSRKVSGELVPAPSPVCRYMLPKRSRSSSCAEPNRLSCPITDDKVGSGTTNTPTVSAAGSIATSTPADSKVRHPQHDHDILVYQSTGSANNGVCQGTGTAVAQFNGLAVGTHGALERSFRGPRFVARLETQPEETSTVAERTPKTTPTSPPPAPRHFREPFESAELCTRNSSHSHLQADGRASNNIRAQNKQLEENFV